MRKLRGHILLPDNAPAAKAGMVLVELRDVSVADAPSKVVASQKRKQVPLKPGAKLPFELNVPDVDPSRSLSLRAHVSLAGEDRTASGDLLTTESYPVGPEQESIEARVTLI